LFPNGGLSIKEGITALALAASLASSIAEAKSEGNMPEMQ
jgi:hypothetical protein